MRNSPFASCNAYAPIPILEPFRVFSEQASKRTKAMHRVHTSFMVAIVRLTSNDASAKGALKHTKNSIRQLHSIAMRKSRFDDRTK